MKRLCKFTLIFICIASIVAVFVSATDDSSFERMAGTLLRNYFRSRESTVLTDLPSDAVASYQGVIITNSEVEYQRELAKISSNITKSDIEVTNEIIQGRMVKAEAERLGLSATEQEITAFVASVQESYTYPDGKAMIDEYCEAAGISVEEYYELVEDHAPAIISKQKLRDEIGRRYCEENGLEFIKINQPQEMKDAVDAYIEELFEEHKDEIIYYIEN